MKYFKRTNIVQKVCFAVDGWACRTLSRSKVLSLNKHSTIEPGVLLKNPGKGRPP